MKLASDIQLLNGLIHTLSRENCSVVAACNAILDLATTSVGLAKLNESYALEKLLYVERVEHFCFLLALAFKINVHNFI